MASALLFYSAARGSPLLGTMLLLLTPLPSLLAGLGWGWLPAAAGAAGRRARHGRRGQPAVRGRLFPGARAAGGADPLSCLPEPPAAARPRPSASGIRRAGWLRPLSLYGGALPVLVLPLIGGSYEALRPAMGEFFRRLSARAPELGLRPLGDTADRGAGRIRRLPPCRARWRPIGSAIFALNLYLGGRIARASGRLGRDWPDLPAHGLSARLSAARRRWRVAASFAPGTLGRGRRPASAAHCSSPTSSPGSPSCTSSPEAAAPWILWFVYAGLLLFGPYTALALTIAGLLEPVLKLGRRFGASPPAT